MQRDVTKLQELLRIIDEFDNFGQMPRDMSLFSVAVRTLRKDKSISTDIVSLINANSNGMGTIALSRILIEDYLHMLFLKDNPDKLTENIKNFNLHPYIEHYASLQAMRDWGIDLSDNEATRVTAAVEMAFEANKSRFLRPHRPTSGTFDPDDYYRTWTKFNLDNLVKSTSLTETPAGLKTLKFITEAYGTASTIVHHNSFNIWLLSSQDGTLAREVYSEIAIMISEIVLGRIINVALGIAPSEEDDPMRIPNLLSRLAYAI